MGDGVCLDLAGVDIASILRAVALARGRGWALEVEDATEIQISGRDAVAVVRERLEHQS